MRDLEATLQEFGEFLLKSKLAREKNAPYIVRWVRRFLSAPASEPPLADQARRFCEELERSGRVEDWQVRQAEHAVRIYFVNFLGRTDWHRQPSRSIVDEGGGVDPLAALEQLRSKLRTRHYSYRTECTYIGWAERFFRYAAERQQLASPHIDAGTVRDYLTHLAVRQHVSASTQNQALCALLWVCRDVIGFEPGGLALSVRARRGIHLPVVLSVSEVAAGKGLAGPLIFAFDSPII